MTGNRSNLAIFLTDCFCCSHVVARLSFGLFFELPYIGNGILNVELPSVRGEVLAVVALNACFSEALIRVDLSERYSLVESTDCQ